MKCDQITFPRLTVPISSKCKPAAEFETLTYKKRLAKDKLPSNFAVEQRALTSKQRLTASGSAVLLRRRCFLFHSLTYTYVRLVRNI